MMVVRFALFLLSIARAAYAREMVTKWSARLDASAPAGKYRAIFEWDHVHPNATVVDFQQGGRVYNPNDDPRCQANSSVVSPIDGLPFWMPRMISRPVSQEIIDKTGIRFASIDWQPCGHKDVTICHAESHYDIHFYYVAEQELQSLPMCSIGSSTNPALPVCRDKADPGNHEYFKLITTDNLPTSFNTGVGNQSSAQAVDFCVDPTSAILRSGVHYGDKAQTLGEWKHPVTILGSHDCRLLFFEPMVSWKWISNNIYQQAYWPKYEVSNITYGGGSQKFKPLPDMWSVEVSAGCKTQGLFATTTDGNCHITMILEGDECPSGNPAACIPSRQCGNVKDCNTGELYKSPVVESSSTTTSNKGVQSSTAAVGGTTRGPQGTPSPVMTTSLQGTSSPANGVTNANTFFSSGPEGTTLLRGTTLSANSVTSRITSSINVPQSTSSHRHDIPQGTSSRLGTSSPANGVTITNTFSSSGATGSTAGNRQPVALMPQLSQSTTTTRPLFSATEKSKPLSFLVALGLIRIFFV